tara:strand:+ start:896 stop:2002 length:1107 start_codon:yes stop_codon:yes gene_type:complete
MKIIFSANSYVHLYKLRLEVIKRLISEGHEIIAVSGNDKYKKKIEDEGIKCLSINISPNSTNVISDFKLLIDYITTYRKIKPDIIFHSTIKPNIYGSIASRILKIKTVNNISGLGTIFFKNNFTQKIVKFLYRISQKKVEKILFQNNEDLEFFLINNFCKKNQVLRIPGSGVNTSFYKKSKNIKSKNLFSFAYIGRPVREKGVIEYIDSAKLFSNSFTGVEFKILGGFDERNSSEVTKNQLLKKIEGYSTIKIEGYQEDIREIYNRIDCLVLPSYREGLSNVIMEACSMEIPVIASNVPGCNELITNDQNGFLFEEKNVQSTFNAMTKIYNLSEKRRLQMGYNGRKKMINNYDIEIIKKIYHNIILNL